MQIILLFIKNTTLLIPTLSDALAVIVVDLPFLNVVPFIGLVIDIEGDVASVGVGVSVGVIVGLGVLVGVSVGDAELKVVKVASFEIT